MHELSQLVGTHVRWPVIPAVCVGALSAVVANLVSFRMIEKLNRGLPEQEHVSYVWWGTEVRGKFKRAYPQDKMVVVLDACFITMVLCFLVGVRYWVFG